MSGIQPPPLTVRTYRTTLLVIPRTFVKDASYLRGPGDAELVKRMEAKARALVRAEVGEGFRESELALGFHWPPWYSVPWLHLHAIYPRREMGRRYKYTPFSFKSPQWVIERCVSGRWSGTISCRDLST